MGQWVERLESKVQGNGSKLDARSLIFDIFLFFSTATSPRVSSELEQARPQTSGEEELQLQLALAMSREVAEQVSTLCRLAKISFDFSARTHTLPLSFPGGSLASHQLQIAGEGCLFGRGHRFREGLWPHSHRKR